MRINYLFLPILLLCLLLNACGILENQLNTHSVEMAKQQEQGKVPTKTTTTSHTDNNVLVKKQDINRLLQELDFLAALTLIRQEVERGASEKELQEEYLSALNGAISQGEDALTGHDPEQAGLLFRATLENLPKDAKLCRGTGLTAPLLEAKINLCADKLMEAGIIAYRTGNLNKAIEEWQRITSFHPRHQASQKAIQTANVQLANLKQIKTGQ